MCAMLTLSGSFNGSTKRSSQSRCSKQDFPELRPWFQFGETQPASCTESSSLATPLSQLMSTVTSSIVVVVVAPLCRSLVLLVVVVRVNGFNQLYYMNEAIVAQDEAIVAQNKSSSLFTTTLPDQALRVKLCGNLELFYENFRIFARL